MPSGKWKVSKIAQIKIAAAKFAAVSTTAILLAAH